jgi:hypothetical protein
MRLSILRRLPRLGHRRVHSDPFPIQAPPTALTVTSPPLDSHTRPRSLDLVDLEHENRVTSILESILSPSVLDNGITTGRPTSIVSSWLWKPQTTYLTPEVHGHLVEFARQYSRMEAQNSQLQADVDTLEFEAELREEWITALQCKLTTNQAIVTRAQHQAQLSQCEREKLERYEKYFELMFDLGLDELLGPGARNALNSGIDATALFIDSFIKLSSSPRGEWSQIIPAVVGPRTQAQYISSINQILVWRKKSKDLLKICKFWKRCARQNGSNADVITPSPSNISSIDDELSEERQSAATELLRKLRSGEIPLRGRIISQSVSFTVEQEGEMSDALSQVSSLEVVTVNDSDSTDDSLVSEDSPTSHLRLPSEASLLPYLHSVSSMPPSESSTRTLPSPSSSVSRRSRLAPLASQVFKEALIASHSNGRFSVSNSYKRVKPFLPTISGHKNGGKENRQSMCGSDTSVECLASVSVRSVPSPV